MNPDHDITRDPPDDAVCASCEGTGEVVTTHGLTLPCPTCMWQEREADVQRLVATIWAVMRAIDHKDVPDYRYANAMYAAGKTLELYDAKGWQHAR